MRIEVRRNGIVLIPEGVQDEVFLESVLGLDRPGSTATVWRVNASGLSCWAYAEIRGNGDVPLGVPDLSTQKQEP